MQTIENITTAQLKNERNELRAELRYNEELLRKSYSDQIAGYVDEILFELDQNQDLLNQQRNKKSAKYETCYCDECTQS